jgi:hypothetical protein
MTTPSPQTLGLLRRAAELRAAANSWDATATKLALTRAELDKLVADHTRDYERFARRARAEVIREAFHEALTALRDHLKSADGRDRFLSSTSIIRYVMLQMRNESRAADRDLARGRPARRKKDRTLTVHAENVRAGNTSELPKVPVPNGVTGAQKTATPPAAPAAPKPVPTPAPVTPPAAPTPPRAPAQPAAPAPATANGAAPLSDAERRKQRLIMQQAVRPGTTAPVVRNGGQANDPDDLLRNWLGNKRDA